MGVLTSDDEWPEGTMVTLQLPQLSGHLSFKRFLCFPRPFATLTTSLFNLCTDLNHLKQIHSRFILHGLHQNIPLSSKLIDCYANFGLLNFSELVFHSIVQPNVDLCSTMVRNLYEFREYKKTLLVYKEIVRNRLCPDDQVCVFVVKACSCLLESLSGTIIHGHLVKLGLDANDSVAAALLEFYRNSDRFHSEHHLFDEMSVRDESLSSLMIYASPKKISETAFTHFNGMSIDVFGIDSAAIVNMLRSSVELRSLKLGQMIHSMAIVCNSTEELITDTALLSMYSKLGSLKNAKMIFDKMPVKDNVVWNIIISAYTRNGQPNKSIELFRDMGKSGVRPDLFTALAIVPALAHLKSINWGKEFHSYITRNCLDCQVSVQNSVIDMYGECSHLNYARNVFNLLTDKTGISWSTIIKGYVKHDQFCEALSLFSQMRSDGVEVDFVTVINILPAFVNIGSLEQVKHLHGYIMKMGLYSLSSVNTAVLVSYAKCGSIEMARKLFNEEEASSKDTIAWNSMISVCAKHGDWSECFDLYTQMKVSKVNPDEITFVGLLTACVNSGLVDEGKKFFKEMTENYKIRPNQEHYAIMVDLLGRSGKINEARAFIESMPFEADARVWGPLLSACKMHSETRVAEFAAEKLISLEPENAGNYILLSNVYAAAGEWKGVAKMRSFLRDKSLKKIPGCSWLEINGKVHEFRVADKSHEKWEDIYSFLRYLELEKEAVQDDLLLSEHQLLPI